MVITYLAEYLSESKSYHDLRGAFSPTDATMYQAYAHFFVNGSHAVPASRCECGAYAASGCGKGQPGHCDWCP